MCRHCEGRALRPRSTVGRPKRRVLFDYWRDTTFPKHSPAQPADTQEQLRRPRARDAEVKRELAKAPLLTLTGVGGSGKTRLALEAARELVNAYPDGVWFVGLAPLSERTLVPRSVAEAPGDDGAP